MKKKNLAFTLAEVLIVIGIIGVVAALTLPNLNHATGDKETVTRLQKAYSILNEANDRAVAIYGPVSSWSDECKNDFGVCWMRRVGEFLKISKSCDESQAARAAGTYQSCESLVPSDNYQYDSIIYQLPDGIIFSVYNWWDGDCNEKMWHHFNIINDACLGIIVDINGPLKGTNTSWKGDKHDIFHFSLSDSVGIFGSYFDDSVTTFEEALSLCTKYKNEEYCTFWPLEFGNLDYLKADESGKCNDSNIILDGTTNTSCH